MLRAVWRLGHILIALHLGSPPDVLAALKAGCIDYVNLSGSAMQVRQVAALADAADVPCWIQMGGLCTGVMAAYSAHLQATIGKCPAHYGLGIMAFASSRYRKFKNHLSQYITIGYV